MAEETLFESKTPAPALPQLTDEYLRYLKAERDASRHTLVNYEIDLRHWFGYYLKDKISGPLELGKISDLKHLREFLSHEMEKYQRSTVLRRLSVIKGFLKFLHREGHLDKNMAKLIQLPRAHDKLPTVLSPEEITQLIDSIQPVNLRHKRMKAVMELLYSTGIRISELVDLNYEHVDFRGGIIRVYGKGRKERMVPIGRHCQKALKDYIDSMPEIQKSGPKTPLFVNHIGERLTVRTVQRNLREVAVKSLGEAGLKVTPHTFRHSCATHLLARGAGLREIQELLGHQSLVTTQKYTQVDVERLKSAYKMAHPKEQKRKPAGNA